MTQQCEIIVENGIRYYVFDERKYPSVTSILSILPKPELILWREMVGKEEAEKIAQERAVIGRCVHHRILQRYSIRQLEPPAIYLPWKNDLLEWINEIGYRNELAELMWQEAINGIDFEPLYVEHALVSRRHKFAGTFDLLAEIHGKNVLIDLKTSKELWDSYKLQLGAYYLMCKEHGLKVDMGMLIGLHPFIEENPDLKPKSVWMNRRELEKCSEKFLGLVERFYDQM